MKLTTEQMLLNYTFDTKIDIPGISYCDMYNDKITETPTVSILLYDGTSIYVKDVDLQDLIHIVDYVNSKLSQNNL